MINLSIRSKLTLGTLLIQIAIITAITYNANRIAQSFLMEQVRLRIESTIPLMNAAIAGPIAQHDYVSLNEILADISRTQALSHVFVQDMEERVIANVGSLPQGHDSHADETFKDVNGDGYLDTGFTITINGRPVGKAHFGISINFLAEAESALKSQTGLIALGGLLIAVALLSLLGWWVTRQLYSLRLAADRIRYGNFEGSPDIRINDTDEMGQLANSFDTMREKIKEMVDARTFALQEAELRYRTVADFTYDWETWIAPDGAWLYCSPACQRITGYAPADFISRPNLMLDIVHPEDQASVREHVCQASVVPDTVEQLVFRIAHRDGSLLWLEHVCRPVFNDQGQYLGRRASNRDITAKRLVELEMIHAREVAEVANVAKNAFLANMSHEMRTPLHQISGMSQLVRREPLTQKQTERMDKLDVALKHMTTMVERILQLTKVEADKIESEEVHVDIDTILRNIANSLHDRINAKGLQWLTEVEPLPGGLSGDAMHIQTALFNLADNAVKFTESGSIVVWIKVVSEDSTHAVLRFEVEDTGVGIAPEALSRLFNLFEQADNSSTRRYGGTGVGLILVQKLAKLMGGEAGCSSTLGAGSSFWFTVKLRKH